MKLLERSRAITGLLAIVIALAVVPGVGWADDDDKKKDKQETSQQTITPAGARPDLSIVVDGLEPPNVEHTLRFKVTNVGKARSTEIKARIQTVSGGPANVSDPTVPPLEPGGSTLLYYGIGSCDGQVVQATVNDPLDFPSANDRAEKVCAPKPPAGSPAGHPGNLSDQVAEATGIESSAALDAWTESQKPLPPEHLRLGQHTGREFPASVERVWGVKRQNEGPFFRCGLFGVHGEPAVGFMFMDFNGCEVNGVYQFIIDFDLQWLRTIEKKFVTRAELLYEEHVREAKNSGGDDVTASFIAAGHSCIDRVGVAPNDLEARIRNTELLTTETIEGIRLKGGWDVTREIQFSMVPQIDWKGFVLHGLDENLDAVSDRACLSEALKVRLRLTYALF